MVLELDTAGASLATGEGVGALKRRLEEAIDGAMARMSEPEWAPFRPGTSYFAPPWPDLVPPSRIRDPPWPLPARSRPRRPPASVRATPRSSPSRRSTGRAASGYGVGEPGTEAAATTTSLAKKYGGSITVVVIDDKPKESFSEHDTQMSSIR
ncbi:hypothetical protein ZWY2020_040014 [Hordeum vulgare]|nr:hypothetical protein ZWY2020_040014 [Hordeum vulgare]